MRERNFRTKITQGAFTLPVASVLGAALWLASGFSDLEILKGLAVTAFMTYLLAELNNRATLLRIRSRMVSTSFLALTAACPFAYAWTPDMLPALCLIAAYFPLLASYGQPRSAGLIFHAGLCIGIGSLFYPPLILLAPIFLVCIAAPLRALSGSSFLGLLFGVSLPFWMLLGYGLWQDCLPGVFVPYLEAFRFQRPDYAALSLPQMVMVGYVTLLALGAMLNFTRTAYDDKIRTRMYFYVFILIEFVLMAALALQPQKTGVLLRLYIVNSTPLIAHHFTLGRGRWLNIWFIVSLLLLVGILVFNHLYGYAQLG